MLGGYGFRRREIDEPSVLLVPVDEFFSKSNLVNITVADSLHYFGSSNGFIVLDIRGWDKVRTYDSRIVNQRHKSTASFRAPSIPRLSMSCCPATATTETSPC